MNQEHNAHGQYIMWSGGRDHYTDEEIERLRKYHGKDTMTIGKCEQCSRIVHTGAEGYNEQTHSYVRYGPYFICTECILEAIDLPELDWGEYGHSVRALEK